MRYGADEHAGPRTMFRNAAHPVKGDDIPQILGSMRVYSFDLGPALEHTGSLLAKNSVRLRFALEGRIAAIAPQALVHFVGATFFLMLPSNSEEEANAIARRINIAVLQVLFGTDQLAGDQLMTMFKPVAAAEQGGDAAVAWSAARPEIPAESGPPPRLQSSTIASAVGGIGRNLPVEVQQDIELRFIPVHDLQRSAISKFFCSPVARLSADDVLFGYKAFERLGPGEYPYVDAAFLQFSALLSERLTNCGLHAVVGSSVNYETLAWTKGRELFFEALRKIQAIKNPYLVVKIDGIPQGIPPSRLADLVSSMKPHIKRIFVHLPEGEVRLDFTGMIGAAGYVATIPANLPLAKTMTLAKSLVRTCEAQGALACMGAVDSEEALAAVHAAGVRFAAGRVFGTELLRWDQPLEDIRKLIQGTPAKVLRARSPGDQIRDAGAQGRSPA